MDLGFLQLTSVAYLIASVALGYQLLRADARLATFGNSALSVGFLLHSMSIGLHFLSVGLGAITTFHEGLSFFAWLVVGSYLIVSRGQRLAVIGTIITPLAFAMTLGAVIMYGEGGGGGVPESFHSPWLPVHVTLAFLGNAVFGVAFAISVVYLVQENSLKSRRRGALSRKLPSLEQLDRLNYRCLAWGFPLLSLGILSGGIWALNAYGRFWSWEAREVLSLLTWILYGSLLQFRLTQGLRGRRAAALTILGFGLVVVSFLSINLLSVPGRHGGGGGIGS